MSEPEFIIMPGQTVVRLDSRQIAEAVTKYALNRAACGPSSLVGGSLVTGEPARNESARGGAFVMETNEQTSAEVRDESQNAAEEEQGKGQEQRAADPQLEYRRQRAADLDGAREVRRFDVSDLELRDTSDGMLRFSGYASVTEHPYEVSDFTETIARGAFKRTLSEQPDVVLLVNHEGLPLARTKSGTLTLSEDARGLRVDADLHPTDPDVQRLVPKMQRGDVDQMSFAFRATAQDWNEDYTQRTIRGVALHRGDVSIVTMAANEAATGAVTTLRSANGELELRAGKSISDAKQGQFQRVLDHLEAADDHVDAALQIQSDALGVQNPDSDESSEDDESDAGDERQAESQEAKVVILPEGRYRERLARLRGRA